MPRKRARPVRAGVVGKGANTATSPATYFTSRTVLGEREGEAPSRYSPGRDRVLAGRAGGAFRFRCARRLCARGGLGGVDDRPVQPLAARERSARGGPGRRAGAGER